MAYVLKIKYENNLRRLTLQKGEIESDSFSFTQLETRIRELFQLPAAAPLAITYTDEESDDVTMGNDQDLKDALVEQGLNPLRIYVTLSKSKGGDKAPAEEAGTAAVKAAAAKSETAEEGMRRVLGLLAQTPVTMKHAFQSYEPLFEGVKSPAQIPALVDNVLQTVFAQASAAIKNGSSAAFGGPPRPPPGFPSGGMPFGGPPGPPPRFPSGVAPFGGPPGPPPGFASAGVPPPPPYRSHPVPPPPSGDSAASAGPSAVPEGSDSENQASLTVHQGVTCDECGVCPIVGNRWKSIVKFDFDLCSECFEKHGNEREYTKIEQPKFRPRHMMHGPPRSFQPLEPSFPPMGPPRFHMSGPHGSHGPHGHFHGGRGFSMRGPFSGFGGRHHCGPQLGADKLYARFVCDVTVFDGTEVAPGTHFVKIWRLRNSGASPWPINTSLVFVGGDELGHVSPVPLEIPEHGLAPEEEMEASVDMVAPEKPGRYVSHWRLASPAGPKFGQRLSVIIQVVPKTTLDSVPPELASVGDDAPAAEEEEFAAGTTTTQTPAGELAEEKEVTVKQVGPLTMFSFEDIEGKSSLPDVLQRGKEQVGQKEVPAPAQSGDFGGGLISMVGDDAVNSAKELAAMTEAGDKTTESVAPPPTMSELWAEAISSAAELKKLTDAEDAKAAETEAEDMASFGRTRKGRRTTESVTSRRNLIEELSLPWLGGKTTESVTSRRNFTEELDLPWTCVGTKAGDVSNDLAEQMNRLMAAPEASEQSLDESVITVMAEQLDAPPNAPEQSDTAPEAPEQLNASPKAPEPSPVEEGAITYPKLEVTQDEGPITYPVVDTAGAGAVEPLDGEDLSNSKALLAKLEAMGFTDAKLNYELLEKNAFDLRKTLDDLCAAEEWDPILEELEEMGFYDTVMNRRLMFKNNGSVKRVVKELVQMYRDIQGKREKVE